MPAEQPEDLSASTSGRARRWWKLTYKSFAGIVSVVGLAYGVVQLPGHVLGLFDEAEKSGNLIDSARHPERLVSASRIGRFDLAKDRTLGAAVRAWGRPDARTRDGIHCLATWERLGVQAQFIASYGSPCAKQHGYFCAAELTGGSWKTAEGLHVDDTLDRPRELYPGVAHTGPQFSRGWLIVPGVGGCPAATIAEHAKPGGLFAITAVETVSAFELTYLTLSE